MVLVLSALLLPPAIGAIWLVRVTANPMNYFRPHDKVRTDAEFVDAALGGAASLEFLVRAPAAGCTTFGS